MTPSNFIDMTERRFGRLVVIERAPSPLKKRHPPAGWLCRCDCGTEKVIDGPALRKGLTRSCGCLHKERLRARSKRPITGSVEYASYHSMKGRCCNPRDNGYVYYGARGITICDRWLGGDGERDGLSLFLSDMGPRPAPGYSLDRIDPDGPYSPENCRWATAMQQVRNRRNTARDGDLTIAELSAQLGIKYATLMERYRRGDRGDVLRRPPLKRDRRNGSRGAIRR